MPGTTETTTRIIEIRASYADALKGIAEYTKRLDEAKEAENALRKATKERGETTDEDRQQLAAIKQEQTEYRKAISELGKEIQNNIKVEKEQNGSLVSLRAELANATKAYDSLSREEREGAAGQEMRDHINGITTELKGAEEETQRFQRNVGNYQNAITGAISSGNPFISQLLQMTKGATGGKEAFKNITTSVQGFGKSLLSLLANPIVALLAGISAAIMAINKAIKSSEELTSRWNAVLAPLQRAMQGLMSVLQSVVGGILSFVEGAMRLADQLGRLLEKLPGVGEKIREMNEANREAIELAKEEADITRTRREYAVQDAEAELEVARLKKESRDTENLTAQERLASLKKANDLEEDMMRRSLELAQREYDAAKQRAEWSENDSAALDDLNQKQIALYKAQEEYYTGTTRLQSQMSGLQKEINREFSDAAAERQRMADEEAKKQKARADAELADVRAATDARIALIKDRYEREAAQEEESYARSLEALQQRLDTETEMTVAQREAVQSQIESLTTAHNAKMTELAAEQAQERVDRMAEYEQVILDARLAALDAGDAREREEAYGLRRQMLEDEMNQTLESQEFTQEQQELIRQSFYVRMEALAQQHADTEDAIAEKNARWVESMERMKQQAASSSLRSLSQSLDQFSDDSRAAAVASKTIALGQIAVETGKAIAAGVAQAQSVPFPANIAAIATTIATVMANINTAISTVKGAKFAEGGVVSGPGSGTSDSVPAMLSNGESVNTALATSMFAPLYSALNQIGGGVAYTGGGENAQLGEEVLARAFERGASRISPVVSVEEISRVTDRVRVVESLGDV